MIKKRFFIIVPFLMLSTIHCFGEDNTVSRKQEIVSKFRRLRTSYFMSEPVAQINDLVISVPENLLTDSDINEEIGKFKKGCSTQKINTKTLLQHVTRLYPKETHSDTGLVLECKVRECENGYDRSNDEMKCKPNRETRKMDREEKKETDKKEKEAKEQAEQDKKQQERQKQKENAQQNRANDKAASAIQKAIDTIKKSANKMAVGESVTVEDELRSNERVASALENWGSKCEQIREGNVAETAIDYVSKGTDVIITCVIENCKTPDYEKSSDGKTCVQKAEAKQAEKEQERKDKDDKKAQAKNARETKHQQEQKKRETEKKQKQDEREKHKTENGIKKVIDKIKSSTDKMKIGESITVATELIAAEDNEVSDAMKTWIDKCKALSDDEKTTKDDVSYSGADSTYTCVIASCEKTGYEKSPDGKSCVKPGEEQKKDEKDKTTKKEIKELERAFESDVAKLIEAFEARVKELTGDCINKKGQIKDGVCVMPQAE